MSVNRSAKEMVGQNFVAQLNEFAQKHNQSLTYEDVEVKGVAHNPTFSMQVVLNNEPYPVGEGRNKKEAKQNAAKNALQKLHEESTHLNDSVTSQRECPSPMPGQIGHPNYVCWLNEYGQKENLSVDPKEMPRFTGISTIQFIVGNREFPEATGKTKKEAKEQAAKLVYEELLKETTTKDQETNDVTVESMDERSQSARGFFEMKNYKGLLNEHCQKEKLLWEFKVRRSGPVHLPQFLCKVIINNKEYPEGQGKSLKDAEQNAAELALTVLQEQSWESSEESLGSRLNSCALTENESPNSSNFTDGDMSSSFISFRDSNNAQSPKESTPVVKSKRKIAANFNFSPDGRKKENNNLENSLAEKAAPQSRFLQDYDLFSRIGKGGFGRVFKARRILEKRFFAVKIVKSTPKALREVTALWDLQHPNIVRYFSSWLEDTEYQNNSSESSSLSGSGSPPKYLYIQMELCENDNLKKWIKNQNLENNSRRRKDAHKIVQQVVQGVEYIHSKKLIHRDLKPGNILFGNDNVVKIGDFGLATYAKDDDEKTKDTGTPSYMSPEQKSNNYDRKVDIFALGLIYSELLWNFTTEMERAEIRNNRFPQGFHEQYSREYKLIYRMLSVEPKERPDASEISKELCKAAE